MWDDEKAHLKTMNELVLKNRVRPTALLPIWNVAGFALGEDVFGKGPHIDFESVGEGHAEVTSDFGF